jgi:hypothetical protein
MPATAPKPKQNYLNNKDILREIHRSKMSYCWLADKKYFQQDLIVDNLEEVTDQALIQAKENRASRMQSAAYAEAMENYDSTNYRNKPKQKDFAVDIADIPDEDVVFRVMTYDHIPDAPGRKKTPKTEADHKEKLNFHPFKHYAYVNGDLTEVARSHWRGDLTSGEFDCECGRLTPTLGRMFLKLVERYSHRANWRSYTYLDEMRGHALMQLSAIALKFNEAKSDNPFGYYTSSVDNAFKQVLNLEKKNQTIRDNILINQGHLPSFSRQLDHEESIRIMRENAESNETFE